MDMKSNRDGGLHLDTGDTAFRIALREMRISR
jgi:hypothetical protein